MAGSAPTWFALTEFGAKGCRAGISAMVAAGDAVAALGQIEHSRVRCSALGDEVSGLEVHERVEHDPQRHAGQNVVDVGLDDQVAIR